MYAESKSDFMAKKNSWGESILALLAMLGGAWLLIELIKLFGKKTTMYSCPSCDHDIEFGCPICPNCKSLLSWPSPNQ